MSNIQTVITEYADGTMEVKDSHGTTIFRGPSLSHLLASFDTKTKRDYEWLATHLGKQIEKIKKNRDKSREYFLKNKERLYAYHRQYRELNPAYEQKRRARARIKSSHGE